MTFYYMHVWIIHACISLLIKKKSPTQIFFVSFWTNECHVCIKWNSFIPNLMHIWNILLIFYCDGINKCCNKVINEGNWKKKKKVTVQCNKNLIYGVNSIQTYATSLFYHLLDWLFCQTCNESTCLSYLFGKARQGKARM